MAFRPCMSCGQRYFGESSYTYVTWFDADERFALRLIECRSCASELRNPVLEHGDRRRDDDWEASPVAPSPSLAPLRRHVAAPDVAGHRNGSQSRAVDAASATGAA